MQHTEDMSDVARIEAELAKERATVADTLDALRGRLTVDSLTADVREALADNIGPISAGLDRIVRANPLAVALIGAGVAWLAVGGLRHIRPGKSVAGTADEPLSGWDDEGGRGYHPPLGEDMSWVRDSHALRASARANLASIEAAAREGFISVVRAAEERADVVARYAVDSNIALRRGLEGLPVEAQDRIVALRERVFSAPRTADAVKQRMLEDQPMVAGAIALAVGACLAAALPRTQAEDRLFGAERDRLVNHAQAMLRAEKSRASDVVADFAGTLRSGLQSTTVRYPRAIGT